MEDTTVLDTVEEAVDTTVKAMEVMEVMVDDVSVDIIVVVGGGDFSCPRISRPRIFHPYISDLHIFLLSTTNSHLQI